MRVRFDSTIRTVTKSAAATSLFVRPSADELRHPALRGGELVAPRRHQSKGPPDPGFARQLGAPKFMGVVMGLLSRKVRKQARKLGVSYSFLFMQANGGQLRELASLYDAGHLRPLIDKTFPFDQTLEALAYVEQGRANGKVVSTLD